MEASQILVSVSLGAAQATPMKLHTVPLSFLTLASISAPIPAAADLCSIAPVGGHGEGLGGGGGDICGPRGRRWISIDREICRRGASTEL